MATNVKWPEPDLTFTADKLDSGKVLAEGDTYYVYRLGDFVVKTGAGIRMAEALTMKAVRELTTIPVPEVLNAYENEDEDGYECTIVMRFVEGEEGRFIGSIDETYCEDQLFSQLDEGYGPYKDEAAFHEGIIKAIRKIKKGGFTEMVAGFIRALSTDHKIVLTHGDLAPRNILVHEGEVVAILDWEMSGYYPEYWEYHKAYYPPHWDSSWFRRLVMDKSLKPFPLENAVLLHARKIYL